MSNLILTRGAPGSGKTTHAIAWVYASPDTRFRVNRDDLRFSMFGKYVLTREQEETVTIVQKAQVTALLIAGMDVMVDDTNLRSETVREWQDVATTCGAVISYEDINTPLEVCISRNAERRGRGERAVPDEVIVSFFQRYIRKGKFPKIFVGPDQNSSVKYVPNPDLPDAYIFDVDGTTMHNVSGRGFFDWSRVSEDAPDLSVIDTAKRLSESGASIVVVSGRSDICYNDTMQSLLDAYMPVDALYMRKDGDMRQDSIIKSEILFNDIAPWYNVLGSFDDRNQVVKFWRSVGITCYQVADGDF